MQYASLFTFTFISRKNLRVFVLQLAQSTPFFKKQFGFFKLQTSVGRGLLSLFQRIHLGKNLPNYIQ
jgi:hypothetical protein